MPSRNWANTALKNPAALVKNAASLPEAIRDIPAKRRRLVAGLIAEYGGIGQIGVVGSLLVDRIGRLWAYIETIDRAAFDTGNPDVRPRDYTALCNSLTRAVQALAKTCGEKRAGNKMTDLRAFVADRAGRTKKNSDKPSVTQPEGRAEGQENARDKDSTVQVVSKERA